MIFQFGKKKNDLDTKDQDRKKRSLDEIESDLTVLGKSEMTKLGGGKDSTKPFTDFPDLRDSLGGTIPL
ncbi:MAG: hypothetical protein IT269_13575 [Saprospiraceae bacterium]|nr:hypothetical protein [Saprospiraceae bacterium]